MTNEIQNILYATDLSKNSAYAFRYAAQLANKLDARIYILNVIEKKSPDAQLALLAYVDKQERKKLFEDKVSNAVERIKKRLKLFCEIELKDDASCLARVAAIDVREGYPTEEILKRADEINCDAIVMGTHEKGLSHTFLGTVAKRVLRRTRIPTFIVPLPEGEIDLSMHDI